MAQHVGMDREWQLGGLAKPLYELLTNALAAPSAAIPRVSMERWATPPGREKFDQKACLFLNYELSRLRFIEIGWKLDKRPSRGDVKKKPDEYLVEPETKRTRSRASSQAG